VKINGLSKLIATMTGNNHISQPCRLEFGFCLVWLFSVKIGICNVLVQLDCIAV